MLSLFSFFFLKEFCLFGCIAVVMDYFLQITLFTTILSIDIRRLELTDLHNRKVAELMRKSSIEDAAIVNSRTWRFWGVGPRRWMSVFLVIIFIFMMYENFFSIKNHTI